MAIFIDSSVQDDIRRYLDMGLLGGVTLNPTIFLRDGLRCDLDGMRRHAAAIAKIVHPFPVSLQVTTNDRGGMIEQARGFAAIADNINVKIPFHGPCGELHNVEVIHELERRHHIRVNATAMMSAQQCLLAAMAGATYVSLFGGRTNNLGIDASGEIRTLRSLLDVQGLASKIIIGSTREVINVIEWLSAGAHIVTVVPKLLEGMIVHPYTKETVQMFLADAEALQEKKA